MTTPKATIPKATKPRKKKAAKPEKRIARTAGIKAIGRCAHEFATRIPLWPIAGEPATASMLAERTKLMSNAVESFTLIDCPDCMALEKFNEAAEEEKAILEGFGLPALPELVGTLRQKSWARQERTSSLIGLVAEQMWQGSSPQLANAVFDHLLSSRFGENSPEYGPEFAPLFTSMRTMIDSTILPYFWSSRSPAPTEKELMTAWLLVHHGVRRFNAFGEERARMWILMSKSRSMRLRSHSYRPDVNLLMATRMVVNTPGWESPERMLAAVEQLLTWSNDSDRGLVSGMSAMSLPEVLEQISVVRALSPREADFPF